MREKVIGLCIAKLQEDDSLNNLELVYKYAHEKNYAVVTYYPGLDWKDGQKVENPDSLYMIDFDRLDAIIIDVDKIINPLFVKNLIKKADEHKTPLLVINGYVDGAYCMCSKVEPAFQEMVRHVITEHSCRKIDLLLGFKDKYNSNELVDIYKEELKAAGIEFDDSRVEYGEYWGAPAESAIDRLLAKDVPDAILCANDAMAFLACQVLSKRGYSVPDDICITGIDGCIRSNYRTPMLTTIKKNPEDMCKRAIETLSDIFAGKRVERVQSIFSTNRYAKTCGCVCEEQYDITAHVDRLYEQKEAHILSDGELFEMSDKILQVSQIEDIAKVLRKGLPEESFFCVKDSFMQDVYLENVNTRLPDKKDKYYIIADSRKHSRNWESFSMEQLCPDFEEMLDDNMPLIVAPVHYGGVHYGYLVFRSFKYSIQASIIERVIMSFNSILGHYVSDRMLRYANNELFHATESMKQMKEHDILTGMFNSAGFLGALEKLKVYCIEAHERIVMACIDLDRLGNINDIYGHSEGDVAIQTIANMLQDSIDKDGISGHLGSDEFVLALHTKEEPEKVMEAFFDVLRGRVENYNAISSKEYSLDINHTYLSLTPCADSDMKAFLDEALSRKRLIKQSRKKISENNNRRSDNIDNAEYKLVTSIIETNKFKYAYQPIVSAKNGEIFGYEALMRADANVYISPLAILKYATLDDRLYEIEYATFFNVIKQASENMDKLKEKKIFVNSIPGYQLTPNDYMKLKHLYPNVLKNVVIEITEQMEMDDEGFDLIRKRSNKDGFQVAVDDFGSGFSNTANLLKYLPNCVKIDRLLITNIHADPKKQHFVKNIIEFAHDNGFLALAEGVETIEEMNAVIHMGVDLIQGFYTAKPSFELIEKIPDSIIGEISEANMNIESTVKKKVFIASRENDLLLMRLALEGYTNTVIAQSEVNLVGNAEYSAQMHIKIKENSDVTLHLNNANITAIEDLPCIDVGTNSVLTIIVDSDSTFIGSGIRVPASSKLRIKGDGNLKIEANSEQCFGIGNDWDHEYGEIECANDGIIDIKCDGTKSIGIGGGIHLSGHGTHLVRGRISIHLTGSYVLGVGSVFGSTSIKMSDTHVEIDERCANGIGVGVWNGEQDVSVSSSLLVITGAGNIVCGIGTSEGHYGRVRIHSAHVCVTLNGKDLYLIGNPAGGFDVSFSKARIDVNGEGNNCVGLGSNSREGKISGVDAGLNLVIKSANPVPLGAAEEDIHFVEVTQCIDVN